MWKVFPLLRVANREAEMRQSNASHGDRVGVPIATAPATVVKGAAQ
jgi:hypothetical protein